MTEHPAPVPPALARGGIDRAAAERTDPDLVARLRGDRRARVVVVHGDRGLVAGSQLHTVTPQEVAAHAHWAFLGRDGAGAPVLLAAADAEAPVPLREVDARAHTPAGTTWAPLRAVGGELAPTDAGLLVEAVCLGRWLIEAPFCPACGGRTQVQSAGWSRRCADCGREHFPRTDPAVIVAVQSHDRQRLLLGKNALWADRNMFSTFAGFVEAGESLETTIAREVAEEAGVAVIDTHYRGSQAWPYPRSLMLGFHARCAPEPAARADGTEIVEVRWFTRAELAAVLAADGRGEILLPGTASIAHRLIGDWVAGR